MASRQKLLLTWRILTAIWLIVALAPFLYNHRFTAAHYLLLAGLPPAILYGVGSFAVRRKENNRPDSAPTRL